jgi:hypothetical protein
MAYISFSCSFEDEDSDTIENLKLKPKKTVKSVRLNTAQICTYYEYEGDKTIVILSNQDSYIIDIDVEDFEEKLYDIENIIPIEINEN